MENKQYVDYMEEYYLKNVDDIDKFLWNELRIMRGCCSSVESFKYDVARAVAEKLWKRYEVQGR